MSLLRFSIARFSDARSRARPLIVKRFGFLFDVEKRRPRPGLAFVGLRFRDGLFTFAVRKSLVDAFVLFLEQFAGVLRFLLTGPTKLLADHGLQVDSLLLQMDLKLADRKVIVHEPLGHEPPQQPLTDPVLQMHVNRFDQRFPVRSGGRFPKIGEAWIFEHDRPKRTPGIPCARSSPRRRGARRHRQLATRNSRWLADRFTHDLAESHSRSKTDSMLHFGASSTAWRR